MSQKQTTERSWLVWVALLATLILCYLASQSHDEGEDDFIVEVVDKRSTLPSTSVAKGSVAASGKSSYTLRPNTSPLTLSPTMPRDETDASVSLKFRNAIVTPSTKDLFHRYVPVVKKTAINTSLTPPSPPVAPKAPFQYVGKLEDEIDTTYFFMAQQRLVSARLGDKLDGLWKLEREDAQSLQLEYMPLALHQSLPKQAQSNAKTLLSKDIPIQVTQ